MKKRIFAALFAAVLLGSVFAGCKHGHDEKPDGSGGNSGTTTPHPPSGATITET